LLCSRLEIYPFQIELAMQRFKQLPRPVLLITNSNTAMNPRERVPDLPEEVRGVFLQDGVLCCSAVELYSAYKSFAGAQSTPFWSELEELWDKGHAAHLDS
jgi:hypothetical protein